MQTPQGKQARPKAGTEQQSFLWAALSPPAVAAIRFGAKLAVAWFVTVQEYGDLALVGVLSFAAAHLACLGIDAALVHATSISGRLLAITARRLMWGASLAIGLQVAVGALCAQHLDDSRIFALCAACAPLALLSNLGVIAEGRLLRARAFARIFRVDIAQATAFAAANALLLYAGATYWSLVGAWYAGAITALYCLRHQARALAPLAEEADDRRSDPAALFAYGRHITISGLAGFTAERIDLLGVGLVLGRSALGLYELALQLPLFIVHMATSLAERGLFPMLAAARRRGEYVGAMRRALMLYTLICLPLCFLMATAARPLVRNFLPEHFAEISGLLPIVSLGAAARGLWVLSQAGLKARGRSKEVLIANSALLCGLLLVLAACASRGLSIVLAGQVATWAVGASVLLWLALREEPSARKAS